MDTPSKQDTQAHYIIRFIINVVVAFVALYGLMVAIPLLINIGFGESWHVIAFYNTFAHWLWLPALALVWVALLLQRWRVVGILLVPIVAFGITYGERFIPQEIAPPSSSIAQFTTMTYNIQVRNGDYDAAIAAIERGNADVVALQEIGFNAAAALEADLADAYPHMALDPQQSPYEGMAILSRHPILESEFFKDAGMFGMQRTIVEVETEHGSRQIIFYNVHPYHPGIGGRFFDPAVRSEGIDNVLMRIRNDQLAHADQHYRVLLGDFNMPDLSDDYKRIAANHTDAFHEVGTGLGLTYTFTSRFLGVPIPPILRIDYIFTGHSVEPIDAWVQADSGGSDHQPVLARLALTPPLINNNF